MKAFKIIFLYAGIPPVEEGVKLQLSAGLVHCHFPVALFLVAVIVDRHS